MKCASVWTLHVSNWPPCTQAKDVFRVRYDAGRCGAFMDMVADSCHNYFSCKCGLSRFDVVSGNIHNSESLSQV